MVALVVLASALFLVHGWRTINAPFGDSHDGRNAGVWAAGSQSLREDGLVRSRLGTRSELGGTYANHPPLIYVETALAEVVGEPVPAATRAPAWVGSLAFIVLVTMLLREAGLRSVSAGVAVTLVAATPMFLVYGTMLDTPVTSLPFGVALLVVWQRARQGRAVRPGIAVAVAALAVVSGWQGLLVAAVVASWALIGLRRGTGDRTVPTALLGGALVGFIGLAGWLLWAFGGSLQLLIDQFRFRTGQSTVAVGWVALFRGQRTDLTLMFGSVTLLLGVGGLVLALRDRRFRALAVAALMVTVPYPLVFRTGAARHDYWDYWFLLPLAIAVGVGCDRLLSALSHRPVMERALPLVAGALAVVVTMGAFVNPHPASRTMARGLGAAEVVHLAGLAPGQRVAWTAGAIAQPTHWLALATGRPAVAVDHVELERLAGDRPGDMVLVGRVPCRPGPRYIEYSMETVDQVAARPPAVTPCPVG